MLLVHLYSGGTSAIEEEHNISIPAKTGKSTTFTFSGSSYLLRGNPVHPNDAHLFLGCPRGPEHPFSSWSKPVL
jgi:hypothetical protein